MTILSALLDFSTSTGIIKIANFHDNLVIKGMEEY